ncbi:MAG: 16S rRNA (guanine(966)-N(2))-methyltransferase RsmD [Anaerolineales bacterium]
MSHLRVISGSAKGSKLKMVPGDITRPIPDRVKEALFNILGEDIPGCYFFDLFAGTGSVGIEALSRGAEFVRFVDRSGTAVKTIKQNLELTHLNENAQIQVIDAFDLLARRPDAEFDYVFVAPPQYHGLWKKTLFSLDSSPDWLVEDGWAIVQIDPKEYNQVTLENFSEFDQRKYGNTVLVFYERIQS